MGICQGLLEIATRVFQVPHGQANCPWHVLAGHDLARHDFAKPDFCHTPLTHGYSLVTFIHLTSANREINMNITSNARRLMSAALLGLAWLVAVHGTASAADGKVIGKVQYEKILDRDPVTGVGGLQL